jgi:CheY-like chemotaxis protein
MAPNGHPILVVEDDESMRTAMVAILHHEGYPVAEADDGAVALGLLRDGLEPCLILLDLMMPGMDGWQFREAQMRDPGFASIPVVVISAQLQAKRLAGSPGIKDVLTKPVDFDQLLPLIREHCSSH